MSMTNFDSWVFQSTIDRNPAMYLRFDHDGKAFYIIIMIRILSITYKKMITFFTSFKNVTRLVILYLGTKEDITPVKAILSTQNMNVGQQEAND